MCQQIFFVRSQTVNILGFVGKRQNNNIGTYTTRGININFQKFFIDETQSFKYRH